MNYQLQYNKLIEKYRNYPIVKTKTQNHHIIPKCFGGSNNKTNKVNLPHKAHWLAHLLLRKNYRKIYQDNPTIENKKNLNKMIYATWRMATRKEFKINSRKYEEIMIERTNLQSELMKNNKNRVGTIQSKETCKKISESTKGIPKSEDHRRKIGEANRKRIISDETKRKQSKWQKGISKGPQSKEHIEKRLETKRKIRFDKEMSIYMSAI